MVVSLLNRIGEMGPFGARPPEAGGCGPAFFSAGSAFSAVKAPMRPREPLREMQLDLQEGADILMVKLALAYVDVLRRARERLGCPMAAYTVSGEYPMGRAAGARGWIDERRVILEILISIRRAGFILSYFAREAAEWIT
jgi:porphobilinogen synthase